MEGKFLATVTTCLPYHLALYSIMVLNRDQDTSLIALARLWFFNILDTGKSSIPMMSWFLTILVEILSK